MEVQFSEKDSDTENEPFSVKAYTRNRRTNFEDARQMHGGLNNPLRTFRLSKDLAKFTRTHNMTDCTPADFVDAGELVRKYAKKDRRLPEGNWKILSNYGLGVFGDNPPEGCIKSGTTWIFRDVSRQFTLSLDDSVLCTLGFEAADRSVFIEQVQGALGKLELTSFYWPRALINVAVQWAQIHHIPQVWVLPKSRNLYWEVSKGENHSHLIYDVSAKREGFVYDSKAGIYRKAITK